MPYNEELSRRVSEMLSGLSGLTEKKMFGGVGFLLHGNMACGVNKDNLIVRVGRDAYDAARGKERSCGWRRFTHKRYESCTIPATLAYSTEVAHARAKTPRAEFTSASFRKSSGMFCCRIPTLDISVGNNFNATSNVT